MLVKVQYNETIQISHKSEVLGSIIGKMYNQHHNGLHQTQFLTLCLLIQKYFHSYPQRKQVIAKIIKLCKLIVVKEFVNKIMQEIILQLKSSSSSQRSSDKQQNSVQHNELMTEDLMSEEQIKISNSTWKQVYEETIKIVENTEVPIRSMKVISATDMRFKTWKMIDLTPFVQLQKIWLNRNQILSIEHLELMYMPNLNLLSLSYNKIVSIRGLRRVWLPKMKQIQLDHNLIVEGSSISQMKMLPDIKLWIYFGEKQIQKKYVNKSVSAKLFPIQMQQ